MCADPGQVQGAPLGRRRGGDGLLHGLGLGRRLDCGGLDRLYGRGLLGLVAAHGRGELLDLGGGLLRGLDPLGLLSADALDRGRQLTEPDQVVGGDGAAARHRVERADRPVEQSVQLFVVEGGDVLGERELFHRAGSKRSILE
ncbi:hypothetical protein ACGH7X_00115 [Streptomyces sp. BBFR51]|uniref:hypothetical protein n=1 Tax=Streptomyces sp. BBFR51 TaxID=3372856 RepID=UPI0037DC652B